MKQEILDALNGGSFQSSDFSFQETGESFQSSVSGFQETGETGDVGTDACYPERSEAESKDLDAPSVAAASRRDSSPRGGAKDEARAVEGGGTSEEAHSVPLPRFEQEPPFSRRGGACPSRGLAAEDGGPIKIGPCEGDRGARIDVRAHWERLRSEAAELPGFDLDAALRDPAFVRLTAPGIGVPVADAWYALHREESERRSAAENRALLARAAAASALRPREGGGSGGAALIASDYRSLPRREQLRVKQRIFEAAARGEKVYP